MTEAAMRTWNSADGLPLFARDYPPADGAARTAVVCLHGLTRNSRDFEVVAPRIAAAGRRVLALDVRGRGRSAWDPNPLNYNPLVYAGDVIALLEQSGISRAHFIGTSMGGLITLTLSALRPDLIAGVVLNDVGPEVGAAGLARIAGYVGGAPQVASWADAAAYARSVNGEALPSLTDADWDRFARRVFRETDKGFALDYDPAISDVFKVAPTSAPAMPAPDLWPLFISMATAKPLLLVRGADSDILEPAVADRMSALIPHTVRVDIPGVGHAPTLEEPQSMAALDAYFAAAS
ncbi:alpha/beta hydrolase [Phenylobacterium sp. 20VBR1]|uniref:Alpha/beta hydrolase n=1 Tax=Phenylobacterium glaciei TaxID=2803784 RepID=A0A941D3E1_9CAUL|nr:alpha/beta hydrolase [Phenylobacterium glaciei]MBR7621396.1 alpha/beta hydrolase [Phenylobacterium glaciei]